MLTDLERKLIKELSENIEKGEKYHECLKERNYEIEYLKRKVDDCKEVAEKISEEKATSIVELKKEIKTLEDEVLNQDTKIQELSGVITEKSIAIAALEN